MEKAPDAFRTISEVADELDVPQHVLRFWESRFREIKPMKRGGGRRYYRPDDVDLLRGIRHLLYGEGYTIRGVQRILKEQGGKVVQTIWQPGAPQLKQRAVVEVASDDDGVQRAPAEGQRGRRLLGILPSRRPDDGARAQPQLQHASQPAPERRETSLPSQRLVPPATSPSSLAKDDVRKLQQALQELTECRAQLDMAIGDAIIGEAGKS